MVDDIKQEQEAPISNEAAEVGLSISDLRIFKEVVDVASARGAFKADEFTTIGDAYSRLATFLTTIDAANAPSEETEEEAKPTEEAEVTPSKKDKKDKK